MQNVFFTSDTHFFHKNVITYSNRPFLSEEEKLRHLGTERLKISYDSVNRMNSCLIDEINKVVGESDVLYHLGDFAYCHKNFASIDGLRRTINCKDIRFVRGNHDRVEEICRLGTVLNNVHEETIQSARFVLCHYSMNVWPKMNRKAIHLYGHSHSSAEDHLDKIYPNRRSMDVGVDNAYRILGKYRPFSFKEITRILGNKKGNYIDHHKEDNS